MADTDRGTRGNRRNVDVTLERFADLAAEIRVRPARCGSVRLVAIDGPGGAGKSTFAERLSSALGGAPVVHTDDFASWSVPVDWWPEIEERLLAPLARGETARYWTSSWGPTAPRHRRVIAASDVLILEGVGSARREAADRLTMAAWIETPARTRLHRGLLRDGEAMRPAWEAWSVAEETHFIADATRSRIDLIVDGAPPEVGDPERFFVRLSRRWPEPARPDRDPR